MTTSETINDTFSKTIDNLQKLSASAAQAENFLAEHRTTLQTAGLVTAAVLVGGIGGYLLAKGALVLPSVVAAKGGIAAAPTLATQAATSTGATTLPATATLVNNSIAGGTLLAGKIAALFHSISANAAPLTAGAIGGGAAGVGATRYQVRQVKATLAEQIAQTIAAQAERSQLVQALTAAKANLDELQAKLATPPAQQTQSVTQPTEQPARDSLDTIKGIGRVFAQKLNAAGIYTFADLAAQTPESLHGIIGTTRAGNMFQPADWIAQAQQIVASRTA